MTEINQNIGGTDDPFVRGDYRQITVPVVDESGNPKTITGATKRYQIWKDGSAVVTKADGDISIVDLNGTDDALRFDLEGADTISLAAGLYQHELEIVDASGKPTTVMQGYIRLTDHLIV